jgi:hypothetical protein
MRKLILLMLIGITSFQIQSQNELDALRYSFLTHGGTARYVAMSGAFGALGADFSSISTNPAGIGSFRTSSVMVTPLFQMNTANADYKNEITTIEYVGANLNNIGILFNITSPENESAGWKNVGFGIGYNKLRTFNNDITINGYNEQNSRLDQFMINSDGLHPSDLYTTEWMAFDTYLTDTIPGTNYLYDNQYYYKTYVNQEKKITRSGGVGEYVFAIGGNYNNVFQIGVSMGLQNIHYTENSTFTESSDSTELSSYSFTEKLETKGTGFNLKLGMIYRPTEFLRIGAAFHTPTFYSLKDVFSYEINSHFRTPDIDGETDYANNGLGENEYSYELYTPMRLVISTALVFAKIGIISADYEFLNYSKARLRAEDYDFEFENNKINSMYSNGHNLRLGAEIKLAPVYLRGGISYYGSPDNNNSFSEIKSYSFGIGLRTRNVFVDFGFNHSYNENLYHLYDYEDGSEFSKLSFNEDLICFTLGYVF